MLRARPHHPTFHSHILGNVGTFSLSFRARLRPASAGSAKAATFTPNLPSRPPGAGALRSSARFTEPERSRVPTHIMAFCIMSKRPTPNPHLSIPMLAACCEHDLITPLFIPTFLGMWDRPPRSASALRPASGLCVRNSRNFDYFFQPTANRRPSTAQSDKYRLIRF